MSLRRAVATVAVVLVAVATTLAVSAVLSRPTVAEREVAEPATEPIITTPMRREVLRRGLFARARAIDNPERRGLERFGVVTSTPKDAGSEVGEGDVVVEIQSRPVMLLSSPFPAWRDLARGSEGRDVEMLQAALARLGYPINDPVGTLGPSTEMAIRSLYEDRGYSPPVGDDGPVVLPLNEILLEPEGPWLLAGGSVEVGTVLAPGGPELALRRPGMRLQIDGMPMTIDPGAILLVWGTQGAEPEQVTVTDVFVPSESPDVQVVDTDPPVIQVVGRAEGILTVEVVTAETDGAVKAAPGTVVATDPDGTTYVERMSGANTERIPVTVGFVADELVELRSEALHEGDQLVVQR